MPRNRIASFQIASAKLGLLETMPGILMNEAFIADGSLNVQERYGEYRRLPGRLCEIYDDDAVAIAAPIYVHAITALDAATKTITISGDHQANINAYSINIDGTQYVRINGSTDNDARYTLVSASKNGANTDIVVSEAIDEDNVDGNLFVGSTPVLAYMDYFKQETEAEHLFLGTAYHILLYDATAKTLTVKFTCTTPSAVTNWQFAVHKDMVYATNNSDLVQVMDTADSMGNSFGDVEGATGITVDSVLGHMLTRAKFIYSYNGYLFLGHVTVNGTNLPQRIHWCDLRDATSWDIYGGAEASYKDFDSTEGFLTGFAAWGPYLVVAKKDSMYRGWETTDDTIFDWLEEQIKVGCIAPDTLINDKAGRLYFLASDYTIRELQTPNPVALVADVSIRTVNVSQVTKAKSTFIETYNKLYFALPLGSNDENSHVLDYDIDSGRCMIHEFPVVAFGSFSRQSVYTYDTLPYDTYNDWGVAWLVYDTEVNVLGFPLDLCSDADGNTYAMHSASQDAAEDMTGTMVIRTTLTTSKHAHLYKHINRGITFVFNRSPVTGDAVTISYKAESASSWTTLGTVDLTNANSPGQVIVHLPANIRGRWFDFQISGTGMWEFVAMYIPEFLLEGTR